MEVNEDIAYYKVELEIGSLRAIDSSFPIFYGFQNLQLKNDLSIQTSPLNYNQKSLIFQVIRNKPDFNIIAGYFLIRQLECPSGYLLRRRTCLRCPGENGTCEDEYDLKN